MTVAVPRERRAKGSGTVVPFKEPDLIHNMGRLVEVMEKNTLALTELTETTTGAVKFVQRWAGWAVAALAVAYPTMGKIVSNLIAAAG